jgi:hypothetical protein
MGSTIFGSAARTGMVRIALPQDNKISRAGLGRVGSMIASG